MTPPKYSVKYTRKAPKDVKGLKSNAERALKTIKALEDSPNKGEPLTGSKLSGVRSLKWSMPGGSEYRAAYVVREDVARCIVIVIATRENFYRKAEVRYEAWKRSSEDDNEAAAG